MRRGNLTALTQEDVKQLDRALGGRFDFQVVPSAASAERFGEMQELMRDGSAVFPACLTAATGGEERGARGGCGEVAEKSRDFAVVGEPIEAKFNGPRGWQGAGELARHGFGVSGGAHGAAFVFSEHPYEDPSEAGSLLIVSAKNE